jgi:hypothetical protein
LGGSIVVLGFFPHLLLDPIDLATTEYLPRLVPLATAGLR